jgi:hypothetical protein
MRDLFPGFYGRTEEELSMLWREATKVAHVVKTEKPAKLRATFLLFKHYMFCLCPADAV